jgi:hypothetical protein
VRIPDIQEDDLQTLWVGTEDNMRLRGPVRGVMGVSPFADPEEGGPAPDIAPNPTKAHLPPVPPPAETATPPGALVEHDRPGAPVPVPVIVAPQKAPTETVVPAEPPPAEFPPADEPPSESPTPPEPGAAEPPINAGPATVRLVPSAPSFRVGDRVTIEVRIDNATNVASVPFHLRYNRQVMEFVPPATQGPFLNSDGANSVFLATDSGGGGEVVVGLSRLGGGEGMSGAGTLATFQFQAINPGDAGFAWVGASVKDPQARNVPATFLLAPVAVEP